MRCLLRFLGLACVAILLVSQQGAPDAFAHGGGGGGHGGGGGGHMGGGGFGGGGHFGGGGFGGGHFGGGYSGGHYGGGYSGGHYGGGYSGGSHYGGYSGGHFSTSPGYSGSSIGSHSSGTQHFGNLGGTSSGLSGGTRHFGGSTLNGANLGSHSITGGNNPSFTQHHAFSSHSGSARTGTHLSAGTGSSHSGSHASALLNHNGANQAQRGQFLNRHGAAGQTAMASHSGSHQLGQMASLGNHHLGGSNGTGGSTHGWMGHGLGARGFGWHNFNRGFFNRGFFNGGFFGFGFGYPFFGYGFGLGYYGWPYWFGSGLYGLAYGLGYGLGYGGYGYGGYGGYYYDPYCTAYGYGYGGLGGYNYPGAAVTVVDPLANDLAANQGATNNGKPAGTDVDNAKLFAEKGENDFRARDYKAAVYDWKHAALDDPTNGVLVMMLSQAFFATGQFNEAAGAVQHGMQLLPKQEWGVVVKNYKELYGNVQDFTDQLRALEKAVKEKPNDPALRFLAGFQYAYLGYPKEAVDQLDKGLKLAPRDEMAKKLRDEMAAKLPKAVEAPAPSSK